MELVGFALTGRALRSQSLTAKLAKVRIRSIDSQTTRPAECQRRELRWLICRGFRLHSPACRRTALPSLGHPVDRSRYRSSACSAWLLLRPYPKMTLGFEY